MPQECQVSKQMNHAPYASLFVRSISFVIILFLTAPSMTRTTLDVEDVLQCIKSCKIDMDSLADIHRLKLN